MNVLKNFKLLKTGGIEEFKAVQVRYEDTDVFTELPVCIVPYEKELQEPILVFTNPQTGISNVVERKDLVEKLKATKIYHFDIKEDGVGLTEVEPEKAKLHQRFPLNVNVDDLQYINGEILLLDKTEVKETKKVAKKEVK